MLTRSLLALALLGMWQQGLGAENEQQEQEQPPLPDLEFLEFLGQFETESGEWIDPESLATDEFDGMLDAMINGNLGGNAPPANDP